MRCITSVHFRHPVRMSRTCFGRYLESLRQSLKSDRREMMTCQATYTTSVQRISQLLGTYTNTCRAHVKKNSCKTKLQRTVVEENISRMDNTSPGIDAVVSSLPTCSAAYLKQTRTSNWFLFYLTMLVLLLLLLKYRETFPRYQDSRRANLSRNPYLRVKVRLEEKKQYNLSS